MKRILLLLSMMMGTLLFAQETAEPANWLSYNLDCQVLTEDGSLFSREITAWTEEAGGYYTELSPQRVLLRFPWQELSSFRDWLGQNSREVYRLDQSSQDLREEILNLRSGLEARTEVLQRNMEYLDKSNLEGTLALEREIRRLMSEIDTRQGQLRRRENDRRMVQAVVNISFLTNSLPEKSYSSFDWINGVDFFHFISGSSAEKQWKWVSIDLPDGFALESKGRVFQAITPEGIRLRLRWVKNYPKMDLNFWEDALETELADRGYLSLAEPKRLSLKGGNEMALTDWGVPYGRDDYRYLTGILVQGNSILILESAGPILSLEEYLPDILEAVEQM